MKIFSTFDTKLKEETLNTEKKRHGEENVHIIHRSKLFFLLRTIIPIIQAILFTTTIIISIHYLLPDFDHPTITGIIIGTIVSLILYNNAISGYIDYTMDYCIITPDDIILTQQKGFLSRLVRTLDVAKIKSIHTEKHSLLHSIFNTGKIVFMSDGDEEQLGEIVFEYISDPEGQKKRIQRIISENIYRQHRHNN